LIGTSEPRAASSVLRDQEIIRIQRNSSEGFIRFDYDMIRVDCRRSRGICEGSRLIGTSEPRAASSVLRDQELIRIQRTLMKLSLGFGYAMIRVGCRRSRRICEGSRLIGTSDPRAASSVLRDQRIIRLQLFLMKGSEASMVLSLGPIAAAPAGFARGQG
jgi:hypothetical protein